MTWKEAIIQVLKENNNVPMSPKTILQAIITKGYRTKEELSIAKTPADTVSATMTTDTVHFVRVAKGMYALVQEHIVDIPIQKTILSTCTSKESVYIIKNYGLKWDRSAVRWNSSQMYGHQNGVLVNLASQKGIYILYDKTGNVIYVGQSVKGNSSIFKRLAAHTIEPKLRAKWSYFSWFGFNEIKDGQVVKDMCENIQITDVANVLEAILIEVLGAPKNDTQGNRWGEPIEQLIL